MASSKWNFKEMLKDYGIEYMNENSRYISIYDTDEVEDYLFKSTYDALSMAHRGYDYDSKKNFDPHEDYFIIVKDDNKLISASEYGLVSFLKENIDEKDFKEWCIEEGNY